MGNRSAKWAMYEGVKGSLCEIPNVGYGSYYGMKMRVFAPDTKTESEYDRFEPCRQVYRWSVDATRACRKRMRNVRGTGEMVQVQDLIQHGPVVRAETREEATKLILEALGKTPADNKSNAASAAANENDDHDTQSSGLAASQTGEAQADDGPALGG